MTMILIKFMHNLFTSLLYMYSLWLALDFEPFLNLRLYDFQNGRHTLNVYNVNVSIYFKVVEYFEHN